MGFDTVKGNRTAICGGRNWLLVKCWIHHSTAFSRFFKSQSRDCPTNKTIGISSSSGFLMFHWFFGSILLRG